MKNHKSSHILVEDNNFTFPVFSFSIITHHKITFGSKLLTPPFAWPCVFSPLLTFKQPVSIIGTWLLSKDKTCNQSLQNIWFTVFM